MFYNEYKARLPMSNLFLMTGNWEKSCSVINLCSDLEQIVIECQVVEYYPTFQQRV